MKKVCLLLLGLAVLGCSSTPPRPAPAPAPVVSGKISVQIKDAASRDPAAEEARLIQAVSGTKNIKIDPKDVIITFSNDKVRAPIAEGTALNWITNLPNGLSATARNIKAGGNSVTILVEGTSTETKNEPLVIVIPSNVLESGSALEIQPHEDIRFDIAEATMRLTAHPETPSNWTRDPNAQYISGSVGNKIDSQDIILTLRDASLKNEIDEETPVSWITNIPDGLTAVVNPAEAGALVLTLTLSGTPWAASDEPVEISIPRDVLGRQVDLDASPGEDIRFDIVGVSLGNVIIGGFTGLEINPKDVPIKLMGGSLSADIPIGAPVSWITNMPAGLRANIKTAKAGAHEVTITVSGTPQTETQDPLEVTIPAEIIDRDSAFVSGASHSARFSIGNALQLQFGDLASRSSNPAWVGSQGGPLNVPALPSIKDFEGLGIISVTTQMVEKLGTDNRYHWSGENVNYAKLMLEARRLGAHGITNVVIDYEDKIEYSRIIRDLEEGHEWTRDETEKRDRGIITVKTEKGKQYIEENTRVITRTYTGTALAIRYINGLNFLEAQPK